MSIVRDLRLVSLLRPTPSHCPETGEYEAKMEPVGAIYISIHLASASRIQQTVRGDEVTHTGITASDGLQLHDLLVTQDDQQLEVVSDPVGGSYKMVQLRELRGSG